MKSKRLSAILLTAMSIKAIYSGTHSLAPFDPLQKILEELEADS